MSFNVGDRVYSPVFGFGKVFDIIEYNYPVVVLFEEDKQRKNTSTKSFTEDGYFFMTDVEGDSCEGYRIYSAMYQVGDEVECNYFGKGVITSNNGGYSALPNYPICVRFDRPDPDDQTRFEQTFTFDGYFVDDDRGNQSKFVDAYRIHPTGNKRVLSVLSITTKEEEEGKCLLLKNIEKDPINPSHYRVNGIPEAIEIMSKLMEKAQYEGFLWGNIVKYAYRYGRKGDKAETAKKIEWYAHALGELLEADKDE